MSFIKYKVVFMELFKDGSISPELFTTNTEYILDENTYHRIRQSGAVFASVKAVVPNPLKAKKNEA